MNWVSSPRTIVWTLLLLTAVALVAAEDSNRRSSKGRRRNGGRTTTTTTESPSLEGDDEDDVEAAAQQDEAAAGGGVETCEVARLKCAYRVGCGMALQVRSFSYYFFSAEKKTTTTYRNVSSFSRWMSDGPKQWRVPLCRGRNTANWMRVKMHYSADWLIERDPTSPSFLFNSIFGRWIFRHFQH